MRVPPRRLHLVSATEIRVQTEGGRRARSTETLSGWSRSAHFHRIHASGRLCARYLYAGSAGRCAVAKRLLDVIGAVILALVFFPLMLLIVVLMRKR